MEEYPDLSSIIVEKGYQGASEFLRTIGPLRKPIGSELSTNQKEFNKKVSSDRVVVENYFGRMCSLWKVLARLQI